jgi:lipopolysaccharide/colanic/teichoic acid biosynthesis glycosyltransferase
VASVNPVAVSGRPRPDELAVVIDLRDRRTPPRPDAGRRRRSLPSRVAVRCLDVVGASVGLVVLAPVMAVVAVLVRWRLGSPVLFRQQRAGLHGRPFELVKFRTMWHAQPGQHGPAADKLRTGRLGRWLRATSLDELPELVNVLRGEMSLVGPRPLPVAYLPRYSPEQQRRHDVKPGLTGWAQINGRNSTTWDERLAMDVWYVDHRSLALDLRIIAATVGQVLRRHGVDHAEGVTMPEFLGAGVS